MMHLPKVVKAALLSLFIYSSSMAQDAGNYRTCDTDIRWEQLLKKYPSLAGMRARQVAFRKQFLGAEQRIVSTTQTPQYIIPVVFHVIHNYGIENISKAQILDAVDILNKSFQKLNDDTGDVTPLFQPIFANCQIEFRLATLDPSGNCTDGITRTTSLLTFTGDDDVKSLIDWPSDQYLNIWVVANIASGAAGYSYYPGIDPSLDGIVIRHDYVGGIGTSNGSNYTERSLAHEVGHWLDLPHTWGSTNSPGQPGNCGTDDGIFDTPNTIGTVGFTCNLTQNTCGQIDNVQNYMDYSGCHKMFTEGQKAVMHAALNSFIGDRNNLHSASNLIATGTTGAAGAVCLPIADFINRKMLVCSGTTINFKDASWGAPINNWNWTFNGGTPASSSIANPSVIYSTPGIYDVVLSVSNASGSDQLTRTGLIEVLPATGSNTVPYAEDFEQITWPSAGWEFDNPDFDNAWHITNATGATGSSKSLRLINFTGNSNGNVDIAYSPTFNLSNAAAVNMTFDLSFAQKNINDNSSLKIYASNNCGHTWIIRYNKSGSGLATTPSNNIFFIPNATQWRSETVSFASSAISTKPAVRFKFEFTNSIGNNIYIDNININGIATAVSEFSDAASFMLFPNPSGNTTTCSFSLQEPGQVSITISDITGRMVYTAIRDYASGDHQFEISHNLTPGLYMTEIRIGNSRIAKKLIIE